MRSDPMSVSFKAKEKRRTMRLAMLLVAAVPWAAWAGGPPGDECTDAITAVVGDNPFNTSSYTDSATPVEGGNCGRVGEMGRDIWFRHTFSSDGLVLVSTCSPGSFETNLSIYDGAGCQALNAVAGSTWVNDDPSCQFGHSENTFVASGGVEYFFRVGGLDEGVGGPGNLNITFMPQNNPCDCAPGDSGCPSEYVAWNAFPIPGPIDSTTDGIFAIWWDGDFSHLSETSTLFSRLAEVRNDAIQQLGMKDPPQLEECLYYNVYIHHGEDDGFPNGWGNGQGTDEHCRPYLTLPDGVQLNESNTYHEGFHIFQYNADSPGFEGPDTYWYIETSAQWYMSTKIPNDDVAFIEAGAIIANPQLALWHSFDNEAPGDPTDWYYQVRQYGMHTLLFFLTEVRGVPSNLMADGFYNGTELSPQQYLYSQIGGDNFRQLFADWAAQNTAGLIYLTPGQVQRALDEAEFVGDPNNFNPYVADVSSSTLETEWTWQPCTEASCFRPRSWAYNAIRISHEQAGSYTFSLDGDVTGSEGAPSHFEARVVVMEPGGPRFESMHMLNARDGQLSVFADASASEVFVVIVSAPEQFTGNQDYGYSLRALFQPGLAPTIFQDGFESGDTSRWSASSP